MPFFLPDGLTELEYMGDGDPKFSALLEGHEYDYNFAFFVAHFGWSIHDYEAITPKQEALIVKAWEEKMVSDSNLMCAAVTVAEANAHRKKGKQPAKLWRKKPKKTDNELLRTEYDELVKAERKKGNGWIQKIRGKK